MLHKVVALRMDFLLFNELMLHIVCIFKVDLTVEGQNWLLNISLLQSLLRHLGDVSVEDLHLVDGLGLDS